MLVYIIVVLHYYSNTLYLGHAHVVYNKAQTTATVTILAEHRDDKKLSYMFDGVEQSSDSITYNSTTTAPVEVAVKGADGSGM